MTSLQPLHVYAKLLRSVRAGAIKRLTSGANSACEHLQRRALSATATSLQRNVGIVQQRAGDATPPAAAAAAAERRRRRLLPPAGSSTLPLPFLPAAVFKGDAFMLAAAQHEIRSKFEASASPCAKRARNLPSPQQLCCRPGRSFNLRIHWGAWTLAPRTSASPHRHCVQGARSVADPAQQQQMLAEGSEAADFLRTSIVQAATNERGAFGACHAASAEHAHAKPCRCRATCTCGLHLMDRCRTLAGLPPLPSPLHSPCSDAIVATAAALPRACPQRLRSGRTRLEGWWRRSLRTCRCRASGGRRRRRRRSRRGSEAAARRRT